MTAPLRRWQEVAVDKFLSSTEDFLLVATPGAGKTVFALEAARRAAPRRIIVVCPTRHLRKQWAESATRFNIHLDHCWENAHGAISRDYDGIVITYQSVVSQPDLLRRHASGAFVVFDEIHHCGDADKLAWGPAVKRAFRVAQRRLLLSGTPFREDGHPIPFVRYEGDPPTSRADYGYGYGAALQDGIVRSIEFRCYDGEARWIDAGASISVRLGDVHGCDVGKALESAVKPEGRWIPRVFKEAVAELDRIRTEVADAGGLVVAFSQADAREYARKLRQITGAPVRLAVSDDADANRVIARFTDSTDPWLVAVNMVSEGVDIPRLVVGVYASRIRTETFFRQVVGRFTRVREVDVDGCARVFVPSVPDLLDFAARIEEDRDHVLREIEARARAERTQSEMFDSLHVLGAENPELHSSILSGDDFDPGELRQAHALATACGIRATPAQAASFMRRCQVGGNGAPSAPPRSRKVTRADRKKELRQVLSSAVNRYAARAHEEHSHVWQRLNGEVDGKSVKHATLDGIMERLDVVDRWTAEL